MCFNVQWADTFPAWDGIKSVVLLLLCLAMICFPFSVAASNILLALVLVTGLFSGCWWKGAKRLWCEYRLFFSSLIAYLTLVCIGLLWSLDPDWGGRILGRHWFWLLLPVVVITLVYQRNRYMLLAAMSFGMTANLVFCVLQANGLIESPAVAGSTLVNATGHIGHTSFGFMYGIWAAWLLHLGLVLGGRARWLLWGLALWALVMVFLAQGKSGYIVSLMLILIVAGKWLREAASRRMMTAFAAVLLLLLLFMAFGPGKERFQGTYEVLSGNVQQQLSASQENAVSSVTARLAWWKMSYDLWLEKPLLGVGTGGFPKAAAHWQEQHGEVVLGLVHPHNQYLFNMVRWGIVGLLLLLILLYSWMRIGLAGQWRHSIAMPLVALTGVALLVDGLSTESLEEHFSTIFALVLAGAGLSESLSEET